MKAAHCAPPVRDALTLSTFKQDQTKTLQYVYVCFFYLQQQVFLFARWPTLESDRNKKQKKAAVGYCASLFRLYKDTALVSFSLAFPYTVCVYKSTRREYVYVYLSIYIYICVCIYSIYRSGMVRIYGPGHACLCEYEARYVPAPPRNNVT